MAVEKAVASPSPAITFSRFQKVVLGWDYLRLLKESTRKDTRDGSDGELKRVKNTYEDMKDYLSVFEPLLFEELKAQIVQVRNEDGLDWQRGVVSSCTESDKFHKVSVIVRDEFREEVSDNDLLLLSKEKFQEGPTPNAYAFALMEHRKDNETLELRTFLEGEIRRLDKFIPQTSPRLLNMLSVLKTSGSFLWVLKVCSLSTIMREYAAIHSVTSLPFKDLILSAVAKSNDENSENQAWDVPRPLMGYLTDNLNESQFKAIKAGLSRQTFVLIQGPPGTGKTQTILGLLSAVLHSSPARMQSKEGFPALKHKTELQIVDKCCNWTKASPWLTGINPRDLIMPVDGDDGFYPTGNDLKPEIVSSSRKYRVHVLVCAPANSALDEIVVRLLHTGLHDEYDRIYNPKIVRVGLKAHHSVQAVSMDYLVEQRLASVDRSSSGSGRALDMDRIRASILNESAIVFSTLSFSGSPLFAKMNSAFDVVIIDEAAQAVEPATLVPLVYGCRQVFLVGDPFQLPATVISSTAQKYGYGTSLFKRFQEAGFPVKMLNTQYRMHPQISLFPSEEFYEGSLKDGEMVGDQTKRPWHEYRCFGPFCFFDIDGMESLLSGSGSRINQDEVDFIVIMYHKLVSQYEDLKSSSQVAVITPYQHQVKLLRERFRANFGELSDQVVDINTVDGFQGREKDVAIFSCVRSNIEKKIGFVSDFRRMNVGITRARSSILVVGSASTLILDHHWRNLVKSAKERNCYFTVRKPYSSFFGDANLNTLRMLDGNKKKPEESLRVFEIMDDILVGEEGFHDMDVDDGGVENGGVEGGYDED